MFMTYFSHLRNLQASKEHFIMPLELGQYLYYIILYLAQPIR